MMKILLLEDDPNLGMLLAEQLESNGYNVKLCRDGVEGSKESALDKYNLYLVDIMMPKKDGFTFVREIRKLEPPAGVVPVIFLTAKSMRDDKIEGFKSGCDDYITKPFSLEELLLRIKALLRRTSGVIQEEFASRFIIGKYNFDSEKQQLQFGSKKIMLTSKESELLRQLCLNINKVTPRESTLKIIWGDDTYFNTRSMDVYISRIRKYLKEDPSVTIQNIHSRGYKLSILK